MKIFLITVVGFVFTACNFLSSISHFTQDKFIQSNTKIYRNEQFNFELDYPKDWVVEVTSDPISPLVMLMSFEPGTLQNAEGVPFTATKIDFSPSKDVASLSLKDYVIRDMSSIDCIVGNPTIFSLANGGKAVEIISYSDMGSTHSIIYADLEGRYFQFVTYGNLEPSRKIVRSLRAIVSSGKNGNHEAVNFLTSQLPEKCYVP